MMGVSYVEFWNLSPRDLHPIIKAFELKQEFEDKARWEQGIYIRLAIVSAMSKDAKYPERNFYHKQKERQQQDIIKERFLRDMAKINSHFKEG